ncbi:hypothetical protein KI387_033932, partial [Taxus chinensis]
GPWDSWDVGTRGARTSQFGRNRRFLSGTSGPKVRGGRELADLAETGDFCVGHPGQKYAEDANRPIRPKQEIFIWDIRDK